MAKIIGMDGNTPPPKQPQLDIKKSKPMVCENCGFDVFIPGKV